MESLRWQEERDRVKRGVDADGDQHVYVNLPVLESVESEFQVKLIGKRAAISLESTLDLCALLLGKELCTATCQF